MITVIVTLTAILLLLSFSSFAALMLKPSAVSDSSLPKIKFFAVKPATGKNIIAWEAEADIPTVYYEVQKSEDSLNFKTVAMILGPKPTTSNHNYFEFGDKPIKQRTKTYYRVKQINTAGDIYYTGIIKSADQDSK
ncbi:MAG: hypothetical protein ACM3H8_12180 [Sphingobacteriales bacterium]